MLFVNSRRDVTRSPRQAGMDRSESVLRIRDRSEQRTNSTSHRSSSEFSSMMWSSSFRKFLQT